MKGGSRSLEVLSINSGQKMKHHMKLEVERPLLHECNYTILLLHVIQGRTKITMKI